MTPANPKEEAMMDHQKTDGNGLFNSLAKAKTLATNLTTRVKDQAEQLIVLKAYADNIEKVSEEEKAELISKIDQLTAEAKKLKQTTEEDKSKQAELENRIKALTEEFQRKVNEVRSEAQNLKRKIDEITEESNERATRIQLYEREMEDLHSLLQEALDKTESPPMKNQADNIKKGLKRPRVKSPPPPPAHVVF